jgi:hypothetical protein
MLWANIVGALILLIIVSYLIQWLVPRSRSKATPRSRYLRWDVAPIVGFFGAILLALAFAQAVESNALALWAGGDACGLIVSGGAWLLGFYRPSQGAGKKRGVLQTIRRYGAIVIGSLIGLYLAVRIFGAALGVFVAAALGVFVIAFAVTLFNGNKPIAEEKNGK